MKRATRRLPRRVVLLVAGALVVVGLAVGANGAMRVWQMERELHSLEQEIVRLRAQTATLTQTLDRLRNDPLYIEKRAREELGYVREGEIILKFPSQPR